MSVELPTLLFFVASWAHRQCSPYRETVHAVANQLDMTVLELDIDDHHDAARRYGILNVPAVSIEADDPQRPIIGVRTTTDLAESLQQLLRSR